MKVSVSSEYEYVGKDIPPVESFSLVVEGEPADSPDRIAQTYLELRTKLNKGIKEKSSCQ